MGYGSSRMNSYLIGQVPATGEDPWVPIRTPGPHWPSTALKHHAHRTKQLSERRTNMLLNNDPVQTHPEGKALLCDWLFFSGFTPGDKELITPPMLYALSIKECTAQTRHSMCTCCSPQEAMNPASSIRNINPPPKIQRTGWGAEPHVYY